MTVKELILELEKFDEELVVVLDGYEGGVTKEFEVLKTGVDTNANKEWYYGESEIDKDADTKVIYLQRERLFEYRVF